MTTLELADVAVSVTKPDGTSSKVSAPAVVWGLGGTLLGFCVRVEGSSYTFTVDVADVLSKES